MLESFTLNSIDIRIPYGKMVGLIDENGAGKTIFISILLNQLHRNKGLVKIIWNG